MPRLDLKYSYYVFGLILLSMIPFFKTFSAIICVYLIYKGSIDQKFMAYSWVNFLMVLNAALIGYPSSIDTFLRIFITILGFFIIFIEHRKKIKKQNSVFLMNTIVCSIFLTITIINNNIQYPSLSFFKLFLFYIGSSFSILLFDLIKNYKNIFSWMFALFINVLIFSFIIYFFFHELGTFKENLFMGSLVHPNKVGMFLLPYLAFYFGMISTNQKGSNLLKAFTIGAVIILFLLSGSRGSFFSLLLSLTMTMFVIIFSKKYRNYIKHILKDSFKIILLLIATIFLITYGSSLKLFWEDFLLKNNSVSDFNLTNLFLQSRGWKIFISYNVFLDNKLLGIGFGAPTPEEYGIPFEIISSGISQEVRITYDPIFGLPIAAPVEKGFFFTGLLEEVGLVGTISYAFFYFIWCKRIILKSNSIYNVLIFFIILSINIFEFQWFSMGSGAFYWLWLGFVTKNANNQINHKRIKI